jgi:enoyl-CoA hydratase
MSDSVLLIDKTDGVATLTLNRPESMNALSQGLRTALTQAFHDLSHDPEVGVVILTGAGRAFCAGLDLKELGSTGLNAQDSVVGGPTDIIQSMQTCDRPIIGAINGVAITGGFEVALACDILIASPTARFADTHARVGVMPGWGLSQKLSRTIGVYRAKELSLTGNFLSAEKAEEWGLVNRVVPAEDLLPTCRSLAKDILSCVPDMVRSLKRVIDIGYAASLKDGLQIEHDAWAEQVRTVTPEAIAARRADIQKRGRAQA